MNTKEIVCLAARYADDKKAEQIKVIDLGGLSSLCDYIVIATVTSKPHLEAVEEEISTKLKQEGIYKINRDGVESNVWRVSDYGSFLVHLMTPEAREFYALDKIFSFGKEIDFALPKPKKAAAKKTVKKATASKKAPAKKAATKKTAAKKSTAKKTVKKTAATPKAAAKKTTTKKTVKKTTKKTAK